MGSMKDLFGDIPFESREAQQLVRKTDPATSFAAAAKAIPHLRERQKIVYDHMLRAGPQGLTDLELEELCGDHGSTYRTRRSELVAAGLVLDSGRTRHQKGRARTVWVAGDGQSSSK